MSLVDILDCYEEVKDDLKFQSMSGVRIKIMISLSEGPLKIEDLVELTGMQSAGILYCIDKLKKEKLILSNENYHNLSKIGIKKASELIDMVEILVVLKNSHELWLNHEIESIPQDLLMKIGDLSNSQLIETKNDDLSKTHRTHTNIVLNAKEVKGVSPIFYLDYIETFNAILTKNIDVELILTEGILKKTIKSHDSEGLDNLKRLISENQLKIYEIKEDVKVAFTVTDNAMTLGLFSKKGKYDSTRLLISDHKNALAWVNKLFEYYLKKARKINLDEFNDLIA